MNLIKSFSKTLPTAKRKLTPMRPSNNLEKKDSFRHILKSSASMYESSSSLFFRTTAGIQSGPDAFETV